MNETEIGTLVIYFMDGTSQQFEFARVREDEKEKLMRMTGYLKQIFEAQQLVLELEDRAMIIPYANIKAIEILPTPRKLPDTAFRNLKRIA